MDKTHVYKDETGEWRWHRKSENGKIVSTSGEGYKNYMDCMNMASSLNRDSLVLVDDDEDS